MSRTLSALAPIVPIADVMTLAGRRRGGSNTGGCAVGHRLPLSWAPWPLVRVVQATNFGAIVWMNGTLLALAVVAALRLPRNALDRAVVQRQANVRALFAAPGFLPLMALAALVMNSDALHDGFEVLRWEDGGIGPGMAGLLWSEGVLVGRSLFLWWRVQCC